MATSVRNFSVKMTSRLFLTFSVVMTMVSRLLRQFRRSLQIKKSIVNALVCYRICWIAKLYLSEKWLVTRIPLTLLKKLLKLHRNKRNNWPMVISNHTGSEITTWIRHSFKTKRTKSRAAFLRLQRLFWISSCRLLD